MREICMCIGFYGIFSKFPHSHSKPHLCKPHCWTQFPSMHRNMTANHYTTFTVSCFFSDVVMFVVPFPYVFSEEHDFECHCHCVLCVRC